MQRKMAVEVNKKAAPFEICVRMLSTVAPGMGCILCNSERSAGLIILRLIIPVMSVVCTVSYASTPLLLLVSKPNSQCSSLLALLTFEKLVLSSR